MEKHETPEPLVDILSKRTLPNCLLELLVSVSTALASLCREESVDRVGKSASLPGFRKGKIPRTHILHSFADKIDREWKELLAKQAAQNVIECLEIRVIPPIIYNWEKLEEGREAELKLSLEVYPEPVPCEDLDFSDAVPPSKEEITESEVESKIEGYRSILSDWTLLKEGTHLKLENKISYRVFSVQNEIVKEEKDQLIKDIDPIFRDFLLSGNFTLGEKIKDPDIVLHYGVQDGYLEIVQAYEKILPPLDDTFAKRFELQSVQELKTEIKKRLQGVADLEYLERAKSSLQDFLVKVLSFDVPYSLLEKEIQSRSSHSENQNLSKEEITEQAREALRLFFFIESVASKNHIRLTQEQQNFIWSQNPPGPQGENGRQRMAAQFLQHEVLLFLLRQIGWIHSG